MRGGTQRDGEYVVLRIHEDDVHSVIVALNPHRAEEPTSAATDNTRKRIQRALRAALSKG